MEPTTITFLVIVGVLAAFYLAIVRPARNEQKKVEQAIRDLRVGDEVVTTAGFFARVAAIETPEEGPVQIVLDFGTGMRVRALTTSILRHISTAKAPEPQSGEVKEA